MEAHEHDRLRRLEARVAALEAQLRAVGGEPPPPEPPPPEPPESVPPEPEPPESVPAESQPEPPPPLARPAPPPPPLPQLPREPLEPKKQDKKPSLEQFIGLTVLGRAGIAAIVVAAAYFGQLGWNRLAPAGRITVIYFAAALMLGAGFALRRRVASRYTAILFGGAIALTYTAGALAKLGFDLVSGTTALVLLVASTALGQWLGRLLRLEAMAVVALAGGYAAPVLVGEPTANPTPFLIYLVALHSWAAWTDHRWQWRNARRLAVTMTTALTIAWFGDNPWPAPREVALNVEFVLAALCAPELIVAFRQRRFVALRWLFVIAGTWVANAWIVLYSGMRPEIAGFGLGLASVLIALGIALRRVAPDHWAGANIARAGSTALAFGALIVCNALAPETAADLAMPWLRVGTLTAAAAIVFALRRLTRSGDLAIAVAAILAAGLAMRHNEGWDRLLVVAALLLPTALIVKSRLESGAFTAVLIGAALIWFANDEVRTFFQDGEHWLAVGFAGVALWCAFAADLSVRRRLPLVHGAAAGLLALAGVAWFVAAYAARTIEVPTTVFVNLRFASALAVLTGIEVARRRVPAWAHPAHLYAMLATALALAWLAGRIELVDAVRDWDYRWRDAVTSLYSTVFAGALLAAGFWRRNVAMRWTGLVGFLLVVAKVAIFDLAALDTPLRVLVTGVLGGVLLIGAYAYARLSHATEPS